ncbi:Hsp20/alpha crystallin family protein [Amycolatopsis keratiniphila]|uniref:Heat-shock protein Hsp20 n=1 Tax=Amycolatopsis keratiniphila subsp. keratiniphila TaxID=227715 RepID=A0A1W2M164_9PSEU|nr:Hsp20/alpha crystallin family protein [Amycolatopsis keratiniphila]ONF73604.1 heat-shock protein Hsp20 [Amycolatopsis keratiniphila subsp. keratiniphila]
MTSLVSSPRLALPSLAAWLENPWPFAEHNPVRIEESTEDGNYVVRAELPGFDPDKGISVTAHNGLLTIHAEREAKSAEHGRSEFYYGRFSRTVSLPPGAETAKISAKYSDGILEVSVPHKEEPQDKQVKIQVGKA